MTGATRILAIDPGTNSSGIVLLKTSNKGIIMSDSEAPNPDILMHIIPREANVLTSIVIEMMDSYGMAVGASTFKTLVWIGRFYEATTHRLDGSYPDDPTLITRRNVKLHLCNSTRATDANVRRACLDRYARLGGGKTPEIGTKSQPGPLYGVKSHAMQALGLALTHLETDNLRYTL